MGKVNSRPSVLPIALRAYLVPEAGIKPAVPRPGKPGWPDSVLILDVETTVDPSQRLTFGSFRQGHFDKHGGFVCLEEGLFYDDALPEFDPAGYQCLVAYAECHLPATTSLRHPRIALWTRRQFLDERLWPAIRGGTLIVGYNLAFDLTRLGTHAAPARGDMFEGGFSVTLFDYNAGGGQRRPNPYRPWLRLKPIDRNRILMGWARRLGATELERSMSSGALSSLLDLRHLAFALTDQKLSLEGAATAFGIPEAKLPIPGHGKITAAYIDYNRQDVALTARLLSAIRVEWDRHPVGLSPERVMSPASVAKGYLRSMGVVPPVQKFKLPPEVLGATMTAYYGGRAEVRVRRVPVPVVYVDFRSMYPTVNTLMRLWSLITAADLQVVDDTAGVKGFMEGLSLERCMDPSLWPQLRFFARIQPRGDILPVRAQYDPTRQGTTIGVNPIESDLPIWVAGPDLVASWLLTGQCPEVLEAIRLVPVGKQAKLQPVALRGQIPIDPTREDFFQRVIEMRQEVRQRLDLPGEEQKRLERLLKVLANSGSYGILAELNQLPKLSRPEAATLYGVDGGQITSVTTVEEPGEFWFPPFAALTTAAARLMLAILERRVSDLGGQVAFGDTDSAAIVATQRGGLVACPGGSHRDKGGAQALRALSWSQVEAIVSSFGTLNPYDREAVSGSILRVEEQNFGPSGRMRLLWAFAISAKRYVLFTRGRHGQIRIVSAKEHGLGHLLDPLGDGGSGRSWIPKAWAALVREALGEPLVLPSWVDRPAVSRITVSTTALWEPFRALNAGKPYSEQIKPMNFGLSVTVAVGGHPSGADPTRFHLLGIFERDPSRWLEMDWLDRYSGQHYRIGVGRRTLGDRVQVKSIRDILMEYRVHPEAKSLGPDGLPCGRGTVGVLSRRPVRLGSVVYIGKESNALELVEAGLVHSIEEVQPRQAAPHASVWDLVWRPALKQIPLARLAAAAGTTERHVRYLQQGKRLPSPQVEANLKLAAVRWAIRVCEEGEENVVAHELAARVLSAAKGR